MAKCVFCELRSLLYPKAGDPKFSTFFIVLENETTPSRRKVRGGGQQYKARLVAKFACNDCIMRIGGKATPEGVCLSEMRLNRHGIGWTRLEQSVANN